MAFTFTSTMPGASPEYKRYMWNRPKKQDRYLDPSLLDFALVPIDANFVRLRRGAYIDLDTEKYPHWFTGYISNDPELTYLGVRNGQPAWGYTYQATSDEYLLSLKPIGVIPPFLNMRQGAILRVLAERLAPGKYDLTGIEDGPLVAQYAIEPDKKFVDVSSEFCNSAAFMFWGNNHKLYFVPQDNEDHVITLDKDDPNFTPARLKMRPASTPIINDVTVLGDLEPQTHVHEYFVGTGMDSSFPLISDVFGVDSSVLIDEMFGNQGIDRSVWNVFNPPQNYLIVDNGYLNCLGGNAYDVRLESISPIALEGRLRLTHGEWDFINNADGYIAGLWTAAPTADPSSCIYGFKVTNFTLRPVVEGVVAPESIPLQSTRRYVLRTLVEFSHSTRQTQGFNYLSVTGEVKSLGGAINPTSLATWHTVVTEVNPADGSITAQWNLRHLSGVSAYSAKYYPVASAGLSCTVTGITISTPLAATLETASIVDLENPNFEEWTDPDTPTGWDILAQYVRQETQFSDEAVCMKMQPGPGQTATVVQSVTSLIAPNTSYQAFIRLWRNSALTSGTFRVRIDGRYLDDQGVEQTFSDLGLERPVVTISTTGWTTQTDIILTRYPNIVAADLKIELSSPSGGPLFVDSLVVLSEFKQQLIGPNEIDAMDGLAPIATIVQSNTGSDTNSTFYGTPQYNPGQSQLVFFKDSVMRESSIPPANQLLRLSYRSAGAAIGRVVDGASILSESQGWGDNGVRSIIHSDITPRPRTSLECEMAAGVLVGENAHTHYEGTYEQWSDYFTSEPVSGCVVKFLNLDSMMPGLQAEEVNEVTTVLESESPIERFRHTLSFGKPDRLRRMLAQFAAPAGTFQKTANSSPPTAVDVGAIRTLKDVYPYDVGPVELVGWDSTRVFLQFTSFAPTAVFNEVRYTDEGWGVDPGRNLVTRTTTKYLTIPRTLRGKVVFVRAVGNGNYQMWSEDLTKPPYSGASVTLEHSLDPLGKQSKVSVVNLAANTAFTSTFSLSGTGCWTFSIKGPAGKVITAQLGATSKVFTLTGYWQRVSLAGTGAVGTIRCTEAVAVRMTRVSFEMGTDVETHYAKTTEALYGPTSRYSTAIHIAFPAPASLAGVDLGSLLFRPTY